MIAAHCIHHNFHTEFEDEKRVKEII